MNTRPILWHIEISHYNEKARWALDLKGVEHGRRALTRRTRSRTAASVNERQAGPASGVLLLQASSSDWATMVPTGQPCIRCRTGISNHRVTRPATRGEKEHQAGRANG
jgi:hypothetical protein